MKKGLMLPLLCVVGSVFTILVLSGCSRCSSEKSRAVDNVAPTVPNGIAITAVSGSEIKISWKPSADDSGKVEGYKVYKNGAYVSKVETISLSDTGLPPQVKFCYRISALDQAGNESAQSPEVCAIL